MTGQSLRQDLKTSLKLTATLTQSIKALQLSSLELEAYIAKEMQDNPFITKEESSEPQIDDIHKLYDKKTSTRNYDLTNYNLIDHLEAPKSLKEHLRNQIPNLIKGNKERFIASYITDLLDDNGYLRSSNSELSKLLNIEEKNLENVIGQLQKLDPAGVYARTLEECLKIQLIDNGKFNEIYEKILSNLSLLGNAEFNKLARLCKIPIESLAAYIEVIKKLEPKPGRNFSNDGVSVKIPDVKITISSNNAIIISSNKEVMPVITINKEYYNEVKDKLSNDNDKNYVSEMLKGAHDLVRSVEMRTKTIILVAQALAIEQEEFFRRGILYLKPLTLAKIAEITGHNESTISRATSNKYIETPYGVIEMKYFFSSGVKSKYSQKEVSSHKVKELIRTLINDENKENPLSDDELAITLKQFNVIAARRTIAKYREAINIPPSNKRKRRYQTI